MSSKKNRSHTKPALKNKSLKQKPSARQTAKQAVTPEEISLFKKVRAGDQNARNEVISRYYSWVTNIARKYRSIFPNIETGELEAEGGRGLLEAVERFDTGKKVKFSTYAWFWIMKNIQEYIGASINLIGVPAKVMADLRKIVSAMNDSIKTGREPELGEISRKLGLHPDNVSEMLSAKRNVSSPLSLDMYLSAEDREETLSDMVEDKKLESVKRMLDKMEDEKSTAGLFAQLSPIEQKVLSLRFGFKSHKTHALSEVGQLLKISPTKAKDIESIAMMKLKRFVSGFEEDGE